MATSFVRFSACLAVAAMIAYGCGGSSNSSSSSTSTSTPQPMPMQTSAAAGTIAKENNALPAAQAMPIPPTLTCTGAIVWVNLSKKTYHMAGDPFYGRTKHGEYMCQSDADAKGYHMAGMPHRHTGMRTMPSPAPT
jgi:hypothetical protein